MDPSIIAFGAIMLGVVCAVIIPFLLKIREEQRKFELSYFYLMVLNLVVAAFALVPEATVEIAFKPLFTLFLAGVGIQGVTNKGNALRIKREEEKKWLSEHSH